MRCFGSRFGFALRSLFLWLFFLLVFVGFFVFFLAGGGWEEGLGYDQRRGGDARPLFWRSCCVDFNKTDGTTQLSYNHEEREKPEPKTAARAPARSGAFRVPLPFVTLPRPKKNKKLDKNQHNITENKQRRSERNVANPKTRGQNA